MRWELKRNCQSSPSDISEDASEEKQGHHFKTKTFSSRSPRLDSFRKRFELFLQWFMLI